jgi:hypothetical protein
MKLIKLTSSGGHYGQGIVQHCLGIGPDIFNLTPTGREGTLVESLIEDI